MTVAGPAVVQAAPAADRDTHPVHKTDPAVRAGPCTPPVPNPVELLAPADVLVSAPRGPVSVLARDLAPPGPVPVVPAASRRLPAKLRGRREPLRSNVADASNIPRPRKAQ
ncbi:MAG: hypothetical protein QOJ51_4433 [Acidobacteriaceae bacterium]|nr:hypothetical protein [Acidobacteriaceae bacterium]